jgi:hypothetical protein
MDRGEEREWHFAGYGDLRLEVCDNDGTFEFRVLAGDGGVFWIGREPDMRSAQDSAVFEAQTFLDPFALVVTPFWRRIAGA